MDLKLFFKIIVMFIFFFALIGFVISPFIYKENKRPSDLVDYQANIAGICLIIAIISLIIILSI